MELLRKCRHAREQGIHRELAQLHQESQAHHQRSDGGALHRLQHVAEGGGEGRHYRPEPVIDAAIGVAVPNLSGGYSSMMPNHHITKPVLIGEIEDDGQFNIVSQTPGLVVAQEWSPYVAETKDLIGDWRKPLACGAFNVKTSSCGAGGAKRA